MSTYALYAIGGIAFFSGVYLTVVGILTHGNNDE